MTALRTRFVLILIYLQINDNIFLSNGLTLQLQTKTTLCEAIKKLDKEINKHTNENPKLSTEIAPNTETLQNFNCGTKHDQVVTQGNACKSLTDLLSELSCQNIKDENSADENVYIPFLETAKPITIAAPNQILNAPNVCDNNQDLPVVSRNFLTGNSKTSGLKLPISVSSTVTPFKRDSPLIPCSTPNLVFCGENTDIIKQTAAKIDTLTPQDLIYDSEMSGIVNPFPGLKLPLSSTSKIASICSTQNLFPSVNSFDVNTLQSPQILKTDSLSLPPDTALPSTVLSSFIPVNLKSLNSDLAPQVTINTDIPYYDLSKSQTMIPRYDSFSTNNNMIDILNSETSKTLPGPNFVPEPFIQSTNSINSPNSSNTNPVLSFLEFLRKTTSKISNNIDSATSNTGFSSLNEMTENFKLNSYSDSSMKQDSTTPSRCFDAYKLPAFSSPALPLLGSSQPLTSLSSNFVSSSIPDMQKTVSSCPVPAFNQLTLYPLPFNANVPENYYEQVNELPVLSNTETNMPVTPESCEPYIPLNNNCPSFPQSIAFCNPCYSSFSSTLPDTKVLSIGNNNPLRSLEMPSMPINQNSPISKYFDDVRAVTSKLNDFISSVSNRLEQAKNVPSQFSNILASPKMLLQPNLVPKVNQIAPNIPSLGRSLQSSNEKEITSFSNIALSDDTPDTTVFYQDNTVIAPKVPQTIVSIYQYPICPTQMAPINYNNFQNSITSLANSNFIPYRYNTLPYSVNSNTYTTDTFDNVPFQKLDPVGLDENAKSGATIFSATISYPYNPYSYTNFGSLNRAPFALGQYSNSLDTAFSSITSPIPSPSVSPHIINNQITPTVTPNPSSMKKSFTRSSLPKKPLPFISSIKINTSPNCEETSKDSNIFSPDTNSLDLSLSENEVLEGSQMEMCCKNLKRMINLLELSLLIDETNNSDLPLSNDF